MERAVKSLLDVNNKILLNDVLRRRSPMAEKCVRVSDLDLTFVVSAIANRIS